MTTSSFVIIVIIVAVVITLYVYFRRNPQALPWERTQVEMVDLAVASARYEWHAESAQKPNDFLDRKKPIEVTNTM